MVCAFDVCATSTLRRHVWRRVQESHLKFIAQTPLRMITNGSKKRVNLTATAEASPAAKRTKPEEQTHRARKRTKKERVTKVEAAESDYEEPGSDAATKSSPAKRKSQKRAKSPVAVMVPIPRTLNPKVLVGSHVSAAGGSLPTPRLYA